LTYLPFVAGERPLVLRTLGAVDYIALVAPVFQQFEFIV